MEILRGIAVSPGVAIGEAVVLEAEDYRIPFRTVAPEDVANELDCLAVSVEAAIRDVEQQAEWLSGNLGRDAAHVLDWHVGVLKDERLRSNIEEMIREKCASAAYATSTVMRNYQRRSFDRPESTERTYAASS